MLSTEEKKEYSRYFHTFDPIFLHSQWGCGFNPKRYLGVLSIHDVLTATSTILQRKGYTRKMVLLIVRGIVQTIENEKIFQERATNAHNAGKGYRTKRRALSPNTGKFRIFEHLYDNREAEFIKDLYVLPSKLDEGILFTVLATLIVNEFISCVDPVATNTHTHFNNWPKGDCKIEFAVHASLALMRAYTFWSEEFVKEKAGSESGKKANQAKQEKYAQLKAAALNYWRNGKQNMEDSRAAKEIRQLIEGNYQTEMRTAKSALKCLRDPYNSKEFERRIYDWIRAEKKKTASSSVYVSA